MKKFENHLISESLSSNTVKSYLSDLNLFYRFTQGDKINREHILSYKQHLQQQSKDASTINRALSAIRKYLEFIGQSDLILPGDFITIQSSYSSPTIVIREEVDKFLRSLKNWSGRNSYRNYCIAVVIVNTGLRISEVLNLRLSDLSTLDTGEITIIGKGNKQRRIVFNNGAVEVLKHYLKHERIRYKHAATSEYVFVSSKAEKIYPSTIQKIFKEHNPKIHPHMLRHFFATNAYDKGLLNLRQLQEQLGHSRLDTVQKYTHPNRKSMIEGLNKADGNFV